MLSGWHKDEITIRTTDGERLVPAWRCREFAIHGTIENDGSISKIAWTVSHVPSGFALPGFYSEQLQALEAAEQIAILRVDWATIDPLKLGDEFRRTAVEIITRCGAKFKNRTLDEIAEMRRIAAAAFANDLNGHTGN